MLIFKKSPLWWFNYCLFQWFGLRLCKKYKKLPMGQKYVGLSFMYWVKPLTGWKTHFAFWGSQKGPKYTRLFWG